MIRSRPVKPRASRMASSVDSVPLLVKRHCGCLKRRDNSSATMASSATGCTNVDRLDDQRVGMPDHHDAEAVVKVDILVAVHVPDPASLAMIDEDRLGRRVLEGRGHASRDELLSLLPQLVGTPAIGTKPLLLPGDQFHDPLGGDRLGNSAHSVPPRDFLTASAEIASSMQRFAF